MNEPSSAPRASRIDLRWGVALFLLTTALFARATFAEFIHLDDYRYVLENPLVNEGLTWDALTRSFREPHEGNWHPVTWISHALDVQLYGFAPGGHHLTSVLLHAATAALLFCLLRSMAVARYSALFAAALFAWHPLRVESVAWVAERKDVLSGLFALCTLWSYVRWSGRPGGLAYARTLLFSLLGLASKPMLITLPLMMLLLDAWPLARVQPGGWGARLREKGPFFALAGLIAVLTLVTQDAGGATTSLERLPLGLRIENALVSCAVYGRQLFLPVELAVFYPHAAGLDPDAGRRLLGPAVGAALLLAALGAWAWRIRRATPWFAFGLAWSGLMLLPVLGLVQVGTHAHADRYTYLPSIGVSITIALFLGRWARRSAFSATGLGLLVLAVSSALTWKQLGVWRNTVTLFEHTLAVTEKNPLAHRILASALAAQGADARALEELRLARELTPGNPDLAGEIGDIHFRRGDFELAWGAYVRARSLGAHDHNLHLHAGIAAWKTERRAQALPAFRAAEESAPTALVAAECWEQLGTLQLESAEFDAARNSFARCVKLLPEDSIAHFNLANALERAGDLVGALEEYRRSRELGLGEAAARIRSLQERLP